MSMISVHGDQTKRKERKISDVKVGESSISSFSVGPFTTYSTFFIGISHNGVAISGSVDVFYFLLGIKTLLFLDPILLDSV